MAMTHGCSPQHSTGFSVVVDANDVSSPDGQQSRHDSDYGVKPKGTNMSSNSLVTPTVSTDFDIIAHFRAVMSDLGLLPEDTGGTITFVGDDPILPSTHRLGACIGIPIMAGAAGIADIWRQRSGNGQDLTLDLRKAIHGINPMYKFMPTINGYPYQLPYFIGNPMGFDLYQTKDGRFFLPTGGLPAPDERHVHLPEVRAGQGQHRQRRVQLGRNGTR